MDRAWTELHAGSDITIPKFYRFIIKYVTPAFLLFILGFWLVQDWLPVMLLKGVSSADLPYVLGARVGLLLLLLVLAVLVKISWRRRRARGERYAA
jgi:pilus assembly protein TadC